MAEEVLLDKNQILDSLKDLPEKVSSEDVIERVLFIKLIEERLRETNEVPNDVVLAGLQEIKRQKVAAATKSA